MLSVSEFMQSLKRNQLFIKITLKRDDFVNHDYPFGCHIHFDNDIVRVIDYKVSRENYLFIIEGKHLEITEENSTLHRNTYRV